eukprot:1486172-Pleurochrysis_carterae.AAC.1
MLTSKHTRDAIGLGSRARPALATRGSVPSAPAPPPSGVQKLEATRNNQNMQEHLNARNSNASNKRKVQTSK